MTAHMKWFDLQAEPVEKPEGGWVNYPSQVCIDTNPKFRHLLSAQELVILQQAARVKELEEAIEKEAEYYKQFALYGTATDEVRAGHFHRRDILLAVLKGKS